MIDEVDKSTECGNSFNPDPEPIDDSQPQETNAASLQPAQLFHIQQERLRFETAFLELQNAKTSSGRVLYVFVRRELKNFHLDGLYREAFILNEAYLRGIRQINQGETIRNPSSWLRGTAYRIIRELHRDQQKAIPFEEEIVEQQPIVSIEELTDDFITLRMAFQMLSVLEQRLLNLKIVEERSFQQICEILKLEQLGEYTESALRKRKERALIRLRKKYHALKPPH